MEIKGKVHLWFEQSGTFKREFIKLGIPAEDYDIQNNFGETDHVMDLFAEIEKGYDGKPSVFDTISKDDLIYAFFPCIHFCSMSELSQHDDFYKKKEEREGCKMTTLQKIREWEVLKNRADERHKFYTIALKMTAIVEINDLRMVVENPWHIVNFTNFHWFNRPKVIDKNRRLRGDYFKKPTAYWFINCEPTHGETMEPCDPKDYKNITAGTGERKVKNKLLASSENKDDVDRKYLDHKDKDGICDTDRSLISPVYARNFICDFILGKEQPNIDRQMKLNLGLDT